MSTAAAQVPMDFVEPVLCVVPGCHITKRAGGNGFRKGMCRNHYLRNWRKGTPEKYRKLIAIAVTPGGDTLRKCVGCDRWLLPECYRKGGRTGRQANCRACEGKSRTKYALARKAAITERWRQKNRERLRAKHKVTYAVERAQLFKEWLAAYGGKCVCCDERESVFLTVEHVKGDGKQHRKMVGTGPNLLRDLKRRGWPQEDFSILCFNCNSGKFRNGGQCPHEEARQ